MAEKEKSSRDYRDKHRSSKDKHYEDDHRHHHHRSKHRSEDGHHRSEREGSRERSHYHDRKEESLEKKHSHKRKDRAESVDRYNADDKRPRVSDKRRTEDDNGRDKRRDDDGDWRDKDEERREKRRFEGKAKEEEDVEVDEERGGGGLQMPTSKKEPTDNVQDQAVGSIAKVCYLMHIIHHFKLILFFHIQLWCSTYGTCSSNCILFPNMSTTAQADEERIIFPSLFTLDIQTMVH